MASINKVIIVGNLGKDPEVRHLPNGDAVATLAIATSSKWKDKNSGEQREETEWHRVVLWRRLGEIAAEYCKKGRSVYVEGSLKTRKWTDQQGVDRYTTEIVGDTLQLLGGRESSGGGGQQDDGGFEQHKPSQSAPQQRQQEPQQSTADLDDDIPF